MQHLRGIIAVANMRSRNNADANLAACTKLVADAVTRGVGLLCLPECFAFMGTSGTRETAEFAQPLDGPVIQQYRALARKNRVWLSLGGFHELYDEASKEASGIDIGEVPAGTVKYFNSHLLVDDRGDVVATYRKIHLFDVDYDGGFRESRFTVPGQDLVMVTDTPFGNVALTTCYDVRFPDLYSAYCAAGADLILVPAAFMPTTGAAHWHILLQARAIETQCYIAAATQYGRHDAKRCSYGHALIADPWGKVVAECVDEVLLSPTSLILVFVDVLVIFSRADAYFCLMNCLRFG
eukprot:INCI13408.1.p1 GENE.INCI13408.1~~INCI13408.1.p1  ORF type:complete len:295 (-),score=43.84 INCI13408.1:367-1251(-)